MPGRTAYTIPPPRRSGVPITLPPGGGHSGTTFTITSVMPTAGRDGGGTSVAVGGTGFLAGMASTLGTVVVHSPTSATITTAGGAPGPFAWSATSGGVAIPGGSFQYLAPGAFGSIAPNNGNPNTTTPGVVVTCTGLPSTPGTGCPIACTVGGNACTAVAQVSGTAFSCTVPAGVVGTDNVVVTIDTVNATGGAGAWTYNPAPTFTGANDAPTGGGNITINGTGFLGTPTVTIGGSNAPVVAVMSPSQMLVTAPAHAAGPASITITNPDGQSVTDPAGVNYVSISTPSQIFTTSLRQQIETRTATTTSGGLITQTNDTSGNAQNATASGAAEPTYVATDAAFNDRASAGMNGTANFLETASFNLSTTSIFVAVLFNPASLGAGWQTLAHYASGASLLLLQVSSAGFRLFGGTGAVNLTVATVPSAPTLVYAKCIDNGGGSITVGLSVDNGIETTATGNDTAPNTTGTLYIGVRNGVQEYLDANVPAWCVVDRDATSGERLSLIQYYQDVFAFLPVPTITAATNTAPTSTLGVRVKGSGFQTGVTPTVNVIVSGTPTACTSVFVSSTTTIQFVPPGTLTAGKYDLQIIQPNGVGATYSQVLNVTSTPDPMTIMGLGLDLWLEQDAVTVSGSNVTGATNKSLWPEDFVGTGGSEPTYDTSGSPVFQGFNFIAHNGSQYLTCLGFTSDGAANPPWYWLGVIEATSAVGSQTPWCAGNLTEGMRLASGTPTYFGSGGIASWGSSIVGLGAVSLEGTGGSGATPSTSVNVNNGAPVSGTNGSSPPPTTQAVGIGCRNPGAPNEEFIGAWTAILRCNVVPTSGQRTALLAYLSKYL